MFASVSQMNLTRIMTLKTPKAIWDYLKEEYEGDERIRDMQVLNLMSEFTVPERYEASIITLENTNLSKISLAEVIQALQA